MKKSRPSKLALHTETVRPITEQELVKVDGGAGGKRRDLNNLQPFQIDPAQLARSSGCVR